MVKIIKKLFGKSEVKDIDAELTKMSMSQRS